LNFQKDQGSFDYSRKDEKDNEKDYEKDRRVARNRLDRLI